MRATQCRFCNLAFEGLYFNCPKCGKWLPGWQPQNQDLLQIEPEENYTVVEIPEELK